VPRDVVIYLGGGRTLERPQTGEDVRYGTLSEFPGQAATVRQSPDHNRRLGLVGWRT
jgi:hypothetical protein